PNAQCPEDLQALECAGHAPAGPGVGLEARDVPPLEEDLALGRLLEAAEDVEDGGLAGAVRPDQPGYGRGLDRQADLVDGDDPAEPDADPVSLQRRQGLPPPRTTVAGARARAPG